MRESGCLKRIAAASALVVLASSSAGCSAFRASAGFGIGLGATARLGVLDVGAAAGTSYEWGTCYGLSGGHRTNELGFPVVVRFEEHRFKKEPAWRQRYEGVVPALLLARAPRESDALKLNRPTEIAVGARLGLVSFHLGFDPAVLGRLILGTEEPEPPITKPPRPGRRAARAGEDGDDGVRAYDEDPGPVAVDGLLGDTSALIRIRSGETGGVAVAPAIALVMSAGLARRDQGVDGEWAAVARRQGARGARDFEQAARTHDADRLERALAAYPIAPQARDAARLLGELRLEQGELVASVEAFELESKLAIPEEQAAAKARVRVASNLLERAAPAPVLESSPAAVELGPYRLTADRHTVRARRSSGEVAWVYTAVAPETGGVTSVRLLGSAHGLAFLAVSASSPPLAIVAVDEEGGRQWQYAVPSRLGAVDSHNAAVLAHGRIFLIERARASALSARTGRLEWAFGFPSRHIPKRIPMECGPLYGPALEGPRVRVTPTTLEWRTDRFVNAFAYSGRDRVVRLDPRTGIPLEAER